MRNTRVQGHALIAEGRAVEHDEDGRSGIWCSAHQEHCLRLTNRRVGQAFCECGEWSPELPSTAARKRWHAEHKAVIQRQRDWDDSRYADAPEPPNDGEWEDQKIEPVPPSFTDAVAGSWDDLSYYG